MAPRANPYRKSNPDTTLELARHAAERLAQERRSGRYKPADVDVLLDAFLDLDEIMSGGADAPDDWSIDESDAPEEDDAGDEDDDEDDDDAGEPVDDED
jgi:hypothetical protein